MQGVLCQSRDIPLKRKLTEESAVHVSTQSPLLSERLLFFQPSHALFTSSTLKVQQLPEQHECSACAGAE